MVQASLSDVQGYFVTLRILLRVREVIGDAMTGEMKSKRVWVTRDRVGCSVWRSKPWIDQEDGLWTGNTPVLFEDAKETFGLKDGEVREFILQPVRKGRKS